MEPDRVRLELLAPEQTVALPEIVPSIVTGLTVTLAVALLAYAQAPLVTTAL